MILALYLYRFGYEDLKLNYTQISDIIGRSPNSIIMRFSNYLNVEREGVGLSGGGERVKEIYQQYINRPKEDLKHIVIELLNKR